MLAPWIIAHMPPHQIYVEPFGGAASVLLRKDRAYADVYNDLDGELVTLFKVLRSPDAQRLIRALSLTPYSRTEFQEAYRPTDDPVERARRMIVRSYMGFGNTGALGRSTGFRASSKRTGSSPATDWRNFPDALQEAVERLRGVIIEHDDAIAVMQRHDDQDTLHYVDPPYVHRTRSKGNPYCAKHKYRFEMTDGDHVALLKVLNGLKGMVMLSGYPDEIYDAALTDWRRIETDALADGARTRREVLWLNPAAARALDRARRPAQMTLDMMAC